MNKLDTAARVRVVSALIEGNSVNSTVRMTGISKPTILKLIADLGAACHEFHDREVQDVPAEKIECDELWAFCYSKAKNVPAAKRGQFGFGDVWTWTAIDATTKLMVTWHVGSREGGDAGLFMNDLASRVSRRIQLTTDGLASYPDAVNDAFGTNIDYAQLIKVYGATTPGAARYSPPVVIGTESRAVCGAPEPKNVSTSYIERSNLTVRMGLRRYTRLRNGFSKKIENHMRMTTIFFVHYNYCRIHSTLKTTPAMAAGLTDRLFEIEDLVALLD